MIGKLAIFLLLPMLANAAELKPAGRIVWQSGIERFGGISGIETGPDGSFIAISDRGMFFQGTVTRLNGRLAGVTITAHGPIPDSKGHPVTRLNTDAEGLALAPDATLFVSFEGNHRVMSNRTPTAAATFLPRDPDFANFQRNSGLEALAIDPQGRIIAIPERSGALTRPFPVYRLDDTGWTKPYAIPRRGDFLVTGADFGPDGRLYVLERKFEWLRGFSTRVRRFTLGPDTVLTGETLLQSPPGQLDNTEGISVWTTPAGQVRITLVSDDNFNPLQQTILSEFVLHE